MPSWEDRMAARAAERRHARETAEAAIRAAADETGPHAGHHRHLRGTGVECSCGEFHGVTCVAFPAEWATMTEDEIRADIDALTCSKCGEHGLVYLGG